MDMDTSVNSYVVVKPPEEIQQKATIAECNALAFDASSLSVFVSGFDSHTNVAELKQYFSNFGDVTSVSVCKTKSYFAFVQFSSIEPVKVVTAQNYHHFLKKRRLYVKRRIAKKQYVSTEHMNCDLVVASLKLCHSVQNQVEELHSKIKLTKGDIETRRKICARLELILLPYYPRCHVTLFGSSANGYGFKGCDVDVLFQANHVPYANPDFEEVIVPYVQDVNSGKFPRENLSKLHKIDELKFIKQVLLYTSQNFSRAILIPSTNCPIIKFNYKVNCGETISCDLSNGPGYPVHNTKLLKLIGKMDNRVIHIMSVLRFWIKYFCDAQNLTSYAFSLLVIFFLQTRNPPVIPTIEYIQSKAGVQVFENGFNCSVPSPCEAEEIEVSSNTQTSAELIAEFFAYYAGFDFVNNVICPLTGNFVSKRVFQTELKDFKIRDLCVQDPFQIDHNVASNVEFSTLLTIIESFQYIDEVFQGNNTNGEFWGILGLFQKIPKSGTDRRKIKLEIIQSAITVQNFKKKFCHIRNVEKVFNHIWLIKAAEILLDVLRHGFLFDFDITDLAEDKSILWRKNIRAKQHNCFKSIDSSMFHSDMLESINLIDPLENRGIFFLNSEVDEKECNLEDPTDLPIDRLSQISYEKFSESSDSCNADPFLTAQFTVSNRVWTGRNLLRPKYQYLENPLDVEHHISVEILKEPNSKLQENLMFDLECYERHSGGDIILLAWLKPFKFSTDFNCLGHYLKTSVPKIIENMFY